MIWFEEDNSNWRYRKTLYRVNQILYTGKSYFQQIDVCELDYYGRALFLDRALQFSESDEALYHEMFVHPAAGILRPKTVCILGGGDGGVCREILKHPSVEKVLLCDIDRQVVEVCKQYFPVMARSLENPKVQVFYQDAKEFIKAYTNYFDVIFVDLTDISSCSKDLYSEEFLKLLKVAMNTSGVVVMQTSGLYFARDEAFNTSYLISIFKRLFRYVNLSGVLVPSFTDGDNSYTYASDFIDFSNVEFEKLNNLDLKFYNPAFAKSSFALPCTLL